MLFSIRHANIFLNQIILIMKGKEIPKNNGDMTVSY